MPDFYTVVTDTGLQALGLASTQGENFSLTQAVVGDGNSLAVIPNKGMTTLVNEVWRGDVSGIKVDPEDPNTFIFEFAIPADTGGFTIREVGLLDESGKLFCIGNFPDTEKPVAVNGSVRDLVVRLPLHFENAEVVNLVINAAVVLATKQDVFDHNTDPQAHRLATTAQTGFVRLATVEEHNAKAVQSVACTPFGVWELLKSLMSNDCGSTSTIKIATSNAVCQLFYMIDAHKKADDPHGVVAKVKALLSNSITSASTTTFATPKAVKLVRDLIVGHTGNTMVHVPTGGATGDVLLKYGSSTKWEKLALVPAGHIYPVPFPPNELPAHHYVPNGEGLLKTSEAGKTLLAMSTGYRTAHGVTTNATHVFLPNVFDSNGDGYFPRFVDGVSRKVGSKQGELIKSHYHNDGVRVELAGVNTQAAMYGCSKTTAYALTFESSYSTANAATTKSSSVGGSENRPKNIGFTPAVYLPPSGDA
ncbi:MAG: phage tail protein [Halodesulfovibrio sp.]|uniref:phage tail protein n=1 Tax=Halodesulfovibrio sp. TaxID=1912772 RepID=UPI00359D5A09